MEITDDHPLHIFHCEGCGTELKDQSPIALEPGIRARIRKPIEDADYEWAKRVKRYVNATGEMFSKRRREVSRLVHKGDVVLDIGVGPGIIVPELGERCGPNGLVLALDISTRVLDEARKNVVEPARIARTCMIEGLSREESERELSIHAPTPQCPVIFIRGDAEHLPLSGEATDLIYSSISLNYTNLNTSIPEISRVLARGGRVYLSIPSWSTRWALEMLAMPERYRKGFPEWFMPDLYDKIGRHFNSFVEWFGSRYPEQLELTEMGWTWREHPVFYYASWKEGEIGDEEFKARMGDWKERVSGKHDDEKVSLHPPPQRFVETIITLCNNIGLVAETIATFPEKPLRAAAEFSDLPAETRGFWIAHTNLRRENTAILRKPRQGC